MDGLRTVCLSSSAQATITKIYKLSGSWTRETYFLYFWRPEVWSRVPAWLGSAGGSFLGCRPLTSHCVSTAGNREAGGSELSCDCQSVSVLIPFMRAQPSWPHLTLVTYQGSHVHIPLHREGAGLQHTHLRTQAFSLWHWYLLKLYKWPWHTHT